MFLEKPRPMKLGISWCTGKEYYLMPEIREMQDGGLVPRESTYKVKDIQPLVPSTEKQPLQFRSFLDNSPLD